MDNLEERVRRLRDMHEAGNYHPASSWMVQEALSLLAEQRLEIERQSEHCPGCTGDHL